ncbi:MAG: hypothetical protein H7337_08810 [Rhizobacter sp.]|nr:hypothetical protein [Rhizobacter sp.]
MQYLIADARIRSKNYEGGQLNGMRAARLGFPGDKIEKILRESGHWDPDLQLPAEPVEDPDAESAAAGSAASSPVPK